MTTSAYKKYLQYDKTIFDLEYGKVYTRERIRKRKTLFLFCIRGKEIFVYLPNSDAWVPSYNVMAHEKFAEYISPSRMKFLQAQDNKNTTPN